MQRRFVRHAVAFGVFSVSVLASGVNAAGTSELDQAIAGAEQRARQAQRAEPAYPSQAALSTALPYRYVGTGVSDHAIRVMPVALSQTEAEAPPAPLPEVTTAPSELATPGRLALGEQAQAPVFSIREDLRNTPRWLWEDTKLVYTSPLNLALLMTAGAASIAVHQHVDWTIADKFDRSRTCKEDWGDAANVVGHPVLHLGIAGAWYLAGYEFKDLKTYNVGKNLLSALIITDLSTLALKVAAADTEAPDGGHFSWPSGHTASTFAMAAVLHDAYGPFVGVPMYALAGWVGFERLDDRQHMFSDVLFGGMLGLVIGHSVAQGHLPQIAGGNILPYADPQRGSGLLWFKSVK